MRAFLASRFGRCHGAYAGLFWWICPDGFWYAGVGVWYYILGRACMESLQQSGHCWGIGGTVLLIGK